MPIQSRGEGTGDDQALCEDKAASRKPSISEPNAYCVFENHAYNVRAARCSDGADVCETAGDKTTPGMMGKSQNQQHQVEKKCRY